MLVFLAAFACLAESSAAFVPGCALARPSARRLLPGVCWRSLRDNVSRPRSVIGISFHAEMIAARDAQGLARSADRAACACAGSHGPTPGGALSGTFPRLAGSESTADHETRFLLRA